MGISLIGSAYRYDRSTGSDFGLTHLHPLSNRLLILGMLAWGSSKGKILAKLFHPYDNVIVEVPR